MREKLQKHIRANGLEKSIFLVGPLGSAALRRFYQAADVLLLTSHYEGMPLAVLEGLACGLPVVATDVGELRSIVEKGRTGELVEPYSAQAMTAMIARVLGQPGMYSASNCQNAAAPYTPPQVFAPMYRDIEVMRAANDGMAWARNA